ncbi:MAG: (2Fe-2S)-binding protein [Fimbriimonadales bacterium]|nr:(2Fe-2S)-binding protein [Fimbriimonadales bacterium]
MGIHRVTVVGHKTFEVEEGAKLALAIEQSGFDISHRCGGQARCTTCRVRFLSEEPPMGEAERRCLEEDGELGNFRLSCQIRVDRDMEVEVLMRASDKGWDPGIPLEP